MMEGLESDFKFGGKEDVKRQNITNANESLREDISIANASNSNTGNSNTSTLVDVLFSIHEYIGDGDSITVDIANVSTLATGVDGMTVTGSAQLQPDSTHLLRVSCIGSFNCEFYIFISKGALFIPSNLEDTGNASGVFMNAGNTITLQFKVNKDNSAQAKPAPSPPPQTPM